MANSSGILKIKIVTPAGTSYSSDAQMVIAPAVQGTVGILPHHIPFFTKLEPGEVKIKTAGKTDFIAVTGGFMDVNADSAVTILTDSAQRSEEIDEKQALLAKQKAEQMLKDREKLSEKEFALAEGALRKSLLDLKISERRKSRKIPSS